MFFVIYYINYLILFIFYLLFFVFLFFVFIFFFVYFFFFFFFSSRRRHTRSLRDWSSDVCSSDLLHSVTAAFARMPPAEGGMSRPTNLSSGESTLRSSNRRKISVRISKLDRKSVV